jgi:hypothetical protein
MGQLLLLLSAGCRNPSTPLTNPFLTPDRVPPPSTRVLTPGAAQPYYPGDPVPGAATLGAPTGALPTAPPPTAYPVGGAYPATSPVAPTTPVAPPGGWGGTPQASLPAAAQGDSIRVPDDQQHTRFAAATIAAPVPAPASTPQLQYQQPSGSAGVSPASSAIRAPAFTPNAGARWPVQQAAWDEAPPAGQNAAGQLQVRELSAAEIGRRPSPLPAEGSGRDGFRPQGSGAPADLASTPGPQGFRSPTEARAAVAPGVANQQFGVGPAQDWLRGQLEYWAETGQWSIRYMPQGTADQIGGRVLIENPQVLGNLPPGEFVVVEGQLFGRQIDDASYQPVYRVATVQRQRR